MPLIEYRDYVMSKNAYYFDSMIQQSGNLIITKNRLILNVIQAVNPATEYDGISSTRGAAGGLRRDVDAIKESIRAIGKYGKNKRLVEYFAEQTDDLAEFEKKVISLGALNAKSINLRWSDVESYGTGLLFGLKVKLSNGVEYSISTMRLRKIKKFLRGCL